MKQNQYYNKRTMNLKQLTRDLEKTGFTCELLYENCDYLCVHYLCFLDFVEISLTGYKEWSVIYYKPFKEISFYKEATNKGVINLLNNLLKGENVQ